MPKTRFSVAKWGEKGAKTAIFSPVNGNIWGVFARIGDGDEKVAYPPCPSPTGLRFTIGCRLW